MPPLSNARHEKFAQELAKGSSATDAMKVAGIKDARNSTRLTKNDEIAARIAELKERAAANVVISREWVLERLVENVNRAMQAVEIRNADGGTGEYKYDGSVANKALELLGKEVGMFVDRTENVNLNHDVSDKPLSEDEWAAQHATNH